MTLRTFIYVAGGTAGHIFPAQALIEYIKMQNACFSYANNENSILIDCNDIIQNIFITDTRGEKFLNKQIVEKIYLSSMQRKSLFFSTIKSFSQAIKILKEHKPDGVFVFGGYITVIPALAAKLKGIPVFCIETNAVMGKANRIIQILSTSVFTTFIHTKHASKKAIKVGFLVRQIFHSFKQKTIEKADNLKILVMGSSIGTAFFAKFIPSCLAMLPSAQRKKINITHHAPSDYHKELASSYEQLNITAKLEEYIVNIAETMNNADIVISRAGASTISEGCVLGKFMLLVPYPTAADDHQYYNALCIEKMHLGKMFSQKQLEEDIESKFQFSNIILHHLINKTDCAAFSSTNQNMIEQNGAKIIWNHVMKKIYKTTKK